MCRKLAGGNAMRIQVLSLLVTGRDRSPARYHVAAMGGCTFLVLCMAGGSTPASSRSTSCARQRRVVRARSLAAPRAGAITFVQRHQAGVGLGEYAVRDQQVEVNV